MQVMEGVDLSRTELEPELFDLDWLGVLDHEVDERRLDYHLSFLEGY